MDDELILNEYCCATMTLTKDFSSINIELRTSEDVFAYITLDEKNITKLREFLNLKNP